MGARIQVYCFRNSCFKQRKYVKKIIMRLVLCNCNYSYTLNIAVTICITHIFILSSGKMQYNGSARVKVKGKCINPSKDVRVLVQNFLFVIAATHFQPQMLLGSQSWDRILKETFILAGPDAQN
jgi:hypothetical protein